ncbi:fumarylacetoacetate hydrolase family protein [Shimia aestuarii]|uniref:Fumarylacetoacetate (FAA) hydrolase family protein n=1 Tax=Shimia aestuarii TaxID=254406 RepID=A0A1I4HM58_9RHOB|nr:fumarylacetoacetate hydrolase family protein [Shimia aestuarii]SFL42797.1 Fumarylacetoacetate (FAA) hydrolase family protein [Shimia aestuarii]
MKLMRFGDRDGAKTPCLLDGEGRARDASAIVGDFGPHRLTPEVIATLKATDPESLPVADVAGKRIAPPVAQPKNIYCIGLNYSDHAAEAGLPVPQEPILFNKSSGTYCGPNDDILYSPKMSKLDWEVELGIVIGKEALNIPKDAALDHILGFTVVNDVSERAWQQERGGQWAKGKSFPNFCPTGPVLVSGDELGDGGALDMWLEVNGKRMQTGNTDRMIFDCATIVSYLSEFIRLEPGDLICTGTPPGVGMGQSPQVWLKPGDVLRLGVEGLGEQSQQVVALGDES